MELIIEKFKHIKGEYSVVSSPSGYCFYDKDDSYEERYYTEKLYTPEFNETKLREKYVVVKGNADDLNAKVMEESNNVGQ